MAISISRCLVQGIGASVLALGLALSTAANAGVVATAGGYEVSYDISINRTLNGNPVTSMVILETDGSAFSAAYGFGAAASGSTLLSHTIAFRPTSALVIGLDLATPHVGDGKTHLVILMDSDFTATLDGKKFSEAFPAIGGRPRLGHDALIAAILAAETGDAAAQQTIADFFLIDAGGIAAFDPAGSFRIGEFTGYVPIDVPEPASALVLLGGLVALAASRRRSLPA